MMSIVKSLAVLFIWALVLLIGRLILIQFR
jgi:hypothetical protein